MLSRETSWIQKKCQSNTMKTSSVGRGRVVCEFASKIAQKRASETGPLQFVLCWLTGGRLSVDCRSSVVDPVVFDRQSVDSRSTFSTERRSSVGQVSVVRRPTRDRHLTDARPTSVVRRPTHDRRTTDARPTHRSCVGRQLTDVTYMIHDPFTLGKIGQTGKCCPPLVNLSPSHVSRGQNSVVWPQLISIRLFSPCEQPYSSSRSEIWFRHSSGTILIYWASMVGSKWFICTVYRSLLPANIWSEWKVRKTKKIDESKKHQSRFLDTTWSVLVRQSPGYLN